ncbi:MAG: methyltransferase family protein [Alistipes indistinctus]
MYSTVRHPIALGNLLAWYGIILCVGVTWFIIGAAMLYTLFTYLVLMSEEEELKQRFGERYTDWARYTNALTRTASCGSATATAFR